MKSNLKFYLVKNEGASAEQAPYLGRVVPNNIAMDADIAADIKRLGVSATTLQIGLVLNALAEVAIEDAKDATRSESGVGFFYPTLKGYFDAKDGKFDEEINTLQVGLTVAQRLTQAVAELVPTQIGAEIATSDVILSNVVDVATKEKAVIYTYADAYLLGNNIKCDEAEEGEKIEAFNAKGELVGEGTVLAHDKGQRIKFRLNVALEKKFTGKIVLTTKGMTGDKLVALSKPVTVMVGDAPAPTELDLHMYSLGDGDAKVWTTTPEGFEGNATTTGGKMIGRIRCDEDPEFDIENAEFVFDDDPSYPNPTFHYVAAGGTFESGKTYRATFARRAGKEAEYTPATKSVELVIV